MNKPNLIPLDLHPGTSIARVLVALSGRPCDLPAEAFRELNEANRRLAENPTEEIEATLRRQAILLEGVEAAFLLKAAEARLPDHQAALAGVALKAQKSLLAVLGALRTLDETRRNAGALEVDDGDPH